MSDPLYKQITVCNPETESYENEFYLTWMELQSWFIYT